MTAHKEFLARVEVEDHRQMRGVITYVEHPGDAALAAAAPICESMVRHAMAATGRPRGLVEEWLLTLLVLADADTQAYQRECARRGVLF